MPFSLGIEKGDKVKMQMSSVSIMIKEYKQKVTKAVSSP